MPPTTIGFRSYADKDVVGAAGSPKGNSLPVERAAAEAAAWPLIISQPSNYLLGGPASRLGAMRAANAATAPKP